MSSSVIFRKSLTTAESALVIADLGSYFFKTIRICNLHNAAIEVNLAITAGRSFATTTDYIIFGYSLSVGSFVELTNILVPIGHQMRGFSDHDLLSSVVMCGVME